MDTNHNEHRAIRQEESVLSQPMVFIIPLFRKRRIVAYAMIDAVDYPLVGIYRWCFIPNKGKLAYAVRHEPHHGKSVAIPMHRQILALPRGRVPEVDHKNGNGIDNRRENLRAGTHAQNGQNLHYRRKSASPYRGVTWDKRISRWNARVFSNRKLLAGKYFKDELEAAAFARDARAKFFPFAIEHPMKVSRRTRRKKS